MLEEWDYQGVYRVYYQAKEEIRALVPKNQVEGDTVVSLQVITWMHVNCKYT